MGGIYFVMYLIGYVFTYPRVFRFILVDMSYGRPDKEEIIFSGLFALLCTIIWPFILLWGLFDKLVLSRIVEHIQKEYRR